MVRLYDWNNFWTWVVRPKELQHLSANFFKPSHSGMSIRLNLENILQISDNFIYALQQKNIQNFQIILWLPCHTYETYETCWYYTAPYAMILCLKSAW